MIAKVIVDVAVNQTDRAFDYIVPVEFQEAIMPGARVTVSFGPRKVQGFVVSLDSTSDYDATKLKPLYDLIDLKPPLTKELLNLANWLKDETLSFHISVLKSMLPAAMRAKYHKTLTLSEARKSELPPGLQSYFIKSNVIESWEDWRKSASEHEKKLMMSAVKEDVVLVTNRVKTNETKKTQSVIKLAVNKEELQTAIDHLSANASKQRQVLEYLYEFISEGEWLPVSELATKTNVTRQTILQLVKKQFLIKKDIIISRDPYADRDFARSNPLPLTSEQETALMPISEMIKTGKHATFLLRGVTGSGKTEVYLQAIDRVLKQGKEAIVLVPEISLTPQMVTRFKERFGSRVAVLHSALSKGEKYDEWLKIREGKVDVAVGARSAIFAPFENLGIIIIDEEHETSYKQEETPRYHARQVAIKRGELYQCPVILGSATPSLESYARARKGVYQLISMEHRVNNVQMPEVTLIDMREELRNGNRSMFSNQLLEGIQTRLSRKEQIVLFLNRRGYATFVMCRDCGYVAQCPHCDISLTYHRTSQSIQCHYCGHSETIPGVCPECASDSIRFFGTGTQKVEEELMKLFPDCRVVRMDVDTTRRKGAHEKLLTTFGEGKADILLGTQMIAKGLDFPNITLVGVLAADSMLHLPDFRSAERTFQLLTQVSGRAGRHEKKGEVMVQTYTPDHYSILDVKQHDYLSFFEKEMVVRKQGGYPPYYYLVLIHVSEERLDKVIAITEKITSFLKRELSENTSVYGPVASAIPRIKDRYRYQCMVKYKVEPKLTHVLQEIMKTYQGEMARTSLTITIDTNPYMML
ncbi:primosomal protein N' [Salipaludibacillus agaradhaerens]|uniref:Replication restart protein PriA n=1 Tax=Salipaludibacillus agaradhaerens TaxID=76935 RepID=A0A9Q4B0C1_SALAG|nr:primosomal protein N' [Salipaludibacillus agaradhaerens]MCR6095984.1 primosomal protein N' [Salipaludibacillus agaradhaerens]MCR6114457.1 primosomal protein N' [Salipaludibacillus agaradhaerens]